MDYAKLEKHLTDNYEIEELQSLSMHGASGGFGDFIYYNDTTRHFEEFKDDCFAVIEEYNDATGETGFPAYIDDNSSEYHLFANSMIWFAIEWIAADITNRLEGAN